jgi:hypothetical protein
LKDLQIVQKRKRKVGAKEVFEDIGAIKKNQSTLHRKQQERCTEGSSIIG